MQQNGYSYDNPRAKSTQNPYSPLKIMSYRRVLVTRSLGFKELNWPWFSLFPHSPQGLKIIIHDPLS